jgi:hypothetical protein
MGGICARRGWTIVRLGQGKMIARRFFRRLSCAFVDSSQARSDSGPRHESTADDFHLFGMLGRSSPRRDGD